jgi:translation initiation factor 5A
MPVEQSEVRNLKEGRYMVVEDEPCEIKSISTSSPGKHGSAKARIEVEGIFDGQKRSVSYTVTDKIKVPIIDKRKAQVVSIEGDTVQLMDMDTYDTFDLPLPEDEDLENGDEIRYLEAMGRKKITHT